MGLVLTQSFVLWAVLAIIFCAIVLYFNEAIPIELTSVGVICALLLLAYFFPSPPDQHGFGPKDILAGFSNPALMTIMALLVMGSAVFHTGALNTVTGILTEFYMQRPYLTNFLLFGFIFSISAFINNTPVVIMFIPIITSIAHRLGMSASRFMIPLSYVCILAGMTTLVGSSTNLLVADVFEASQGRAITFFEPTLPGLILASAGLIYLMLFGRYLLPNHAVENGKGEYDGRQYIAQLEITSGHPLEGAVPVAGIFPQLEHMTVRMVFRKERNELPPFEKTLQAGDVLVLALTRSRLEELLNTHREWFIDTAADGTVRAMSQQGGDRPDFSPDLAIHEAVLAPGSSLINRPVKQVMFHKEYNNFILAVQRRDRMLRRRLDDIRLEAGDVLLLHGSLQGLESLRRNQDIILLEWSKTHLPNRTKARLTRGIFAASMLLAATGYLPILYASLLGAFCMIAFRCINIRQALRAFDSRVYFLISAAFAMAFALEHSGAAALIAGGFVTLFAHSEPLILLSALFFLVMVMTNILSNSATALLFTPIALKMAPLVDGDPFVFAMTVLFAANVCFVTPIAYQTNLLVMGPGRYRFSDFIRVGAPLALILWLVFIAVLHWLYGV